MICSCVPRQMLKRKTIICVLSCLIPSLEVFLYQKSDDDYKTGDDSDKKEDDRYQQDAYIHRQGTDKYLKSDRRVTEDFL